MGQGNFELAKKQREAKDFYRRAGYEEAMQDVLAWLKKQRESEEAEIIGTYRTAWTVASIQLDSGAAKGASKK